MPGDVTRQPSYDSLSEEQLRRESSNSSFNQHESLSRGMSLMHPDESQSSFDDMVPNSSISDFEALSNTATVSSHHGGILTNYNGTSLPAPHQFIDILSAQYLLSASQAATLHNLAWIGKTLDAGDLLYRLFDSAIQFSTQNLLRANQIHHTKLDRIVEQIDETFKFNQMQRNTAIAVTRDAIFNPRKRDYEGVYLRVKSILEKEFNRLGFKAFADHPVHAKAYDTEIKKRCRNILNQFRSELIGSAVGPPRGEKMELETCVIKFAGKYKMEKKTEIGQDHKDRIALLRRFIREHPEYYSSPFQTTTVVVTEEEEEEGEGEEEEEDESEESRPISPAPPAAKKQRMSTGSSQVPVKGKANGLPGFWAAIDEWLKGLTKKWGNSTDAAGWKQYLKETLELERASSQLIPDISFGSIVGGLPSLRTARATTLAVSERMALQSTVSDSSPSPGNTSDSTNPELNHHLPGNNVSHRNPILAAPRPKPRPRILTDFSPTGVSPHSTGTIETTGTSQNRETVQAGIPQRNSHSTLDTQNHQGRGFHDPCFDHSPTPPTLSPLIFSPTLPSLPQIRTRDQISHPSRSPYMSHGPTTTAHYLPRNEHTLQIPTSIPDNSRPRVLSPSIPPFRNSDAGRSRVQSPSPLRGVYYNSDQFQHLSGLPGDRPHGLTGSLGGGNYHPSGIYGAGTNVGGMTYGGGQVEGRSTGTEHEAYGGHWPAP